MTYPASDLNGWAGFENDFDIFDPDDAGLNMDEWYEFYVADIMTRLRPTEDTWVTRKGKRILVKDMEDAHIVNTIKMIERNGAYKLPTYATLVVEARARKLDLNIPSFSAPLRKALTRLADGYGIPSRIITHLESCIRADLKNAYRSGQLPQSTGIKVRR